MSNADLSIQPPAARRLRLLGIAGAMAAAAAGFALLRLRDHAPDLALLAAAPSKIQIHLAAALLALVIGTVLMIGVKGTALHRALGWTWVAAMATTAITSLFIRMSGTMSWIHLLSGWTIIALPIAVYAARRHKVALHRRFMTGLFVGGLIVAGGFAFVPGRLLWRVFFA